MFISLDDDVNMTLKPGIGAITYNTEVTRLGALEPLRRTLRALRQHVCLRGSDVAGRGYPAERLQTISLPQTHR